VACPELHLLRLPALPWQGVKTRYHEIEFSRIQYSSALYTGLGPVEPRRGVR